MGVEIDEQLATVSVSDITVQNGTLFNSDLADQTARFSVNQGFTTVTFTNVRTPVGGCLTVGC